MRLSFSILLVHAIIGGSQATPDDGVDVDRIVGGTDAVLGEFPYFAHTGCTRWSCGGALIARNAVLTAAHCGPLDDFELTIGSFDPQALTDGAVKRQCAKYIPHPQYNPNNLNMDFGICILDEPVDIMSDIKHELNTARSIPQAGDDLIVIGHGNTGFQAGGNCALDKLQKVTVPAVPNKECKDLLPFPFTKNMLCAGYEEGGKDSCQGDSGGPIYKRFTSGDGTVTHVHVGVVSWGIGCADPNSPGVYARTSAAMDFIRDTVCSLPDNGADFCSGTVAPVPSPTRRPTTPRPSPIPCTGARLDVSITPPSEGYETTMTINNMNLPFVSESVTFDSLDEKKFQFCLEKEECYVFALEDSEKSSGGSGEIKLRLSGRPFVTTPADFSTQFCVNGRGIGVHCNDYEGTLLSNGPYQKCNQLLNEDEASVKDFCKKKVPLFPGARVKSICPVACGIVGDSQCNLIAQYF